MAEQKPLAALATRKYPGWSAQACQQIIGEFCEAVDSTRQVRANGLMEASYPWRRPRYRDVVYTNPDARLRDGQLISPHGASGPLRIRIPTPITWPGRLMEVRLSYGRVRLVCETPDEPPAEQTVIGVDLGVNTLIAAPNRQWAVLVSGRHGTALAQWRNKRLASMTRKQAPMAKGSRRWKRMQRRKHAMLDKTPRQVRDAWRQATHIVKTALPGATRYGGEPFNDASPTMGRRQARQVSRACTRKLMNPLDYKTAGAIPVNEAYSSQTCPVCGERSEHKRTYRGPKCGATGPRDVVGAVNMLSIGVHHARLPGRAIPAQVTYRR
jgi:putative transposase